jgi:drug/metabolite transporter (DMT)-like permease
LKSKANTILWAIAACVLWSSVYPTIKIGLEHAPPFHFAGARFMLSGLLVLPFTLSPGRYFEMLRHNLKPVLWVTLLQTLINYTLFYHGLKFVPGALGAVIVGSQPLITAIVSAAVIREDRLSTGKIIAIISGISGVILISAGRQALRMGSAAELLGVIMILAANIATATSNVMVSSGSRQLNPFVLSSFSLFAGGSGLMLMSILFETQPGFNLPAGYWAVLGWLSLVSAFSFSIWYMLLQRPGVKVSELNLWKFIIPGLGAVLSWMMIPEEKPDWLTVSGIIIITATLIVFFRRKKTSSTG